MKKIICLVICVLMSVGMLAGCNLFQPNLGDDYSQVIAVIAPITTTRTETIVVRNEDGYPVKDVEGVVQTKPSTKSEYTTPEIKIYKSQLVNYVNYYLSNEISSSTSAKDGLVKKNVENYLDMLISGEILSAEADRLFDAGVLYWTVEDVNSIQNSVYTSINNSISNYKNQLLKSKGLAEIATPEAETDPVQPTYPLDPTMQPDEGEKVSPEYKLSQEAVTKGEHQWFDSWYLNDKWYIENPNYASSYPGLSGDNRELSRAAFSLYLEEMFTNSEDLIGVSEEDSKIVEGEVKALKKIIDTKGVAYVYPILGKTLMIKLLVGNSYIRTQKLTKLETYITEDTTVSEEDITKYYNRLLANQKISFLNQANYDEAAAGSSPSTILYTPSNRYVFVKHILLPFSEEQTAKLDAIKAAEGANKENISDERKAVIEARRAELAREIVVYPHVNGENDTANPMTVAQVTTEITDIMDNYINNPRMAEYAFDRLIYKYNTDPGIFGNEKGYAVVYELDEGESEKYMVEFAEAARAFRTDGYDIGNIYYNNDILDERSNPVPYIITDYGIHVMYYCLDPVAGEEKGLNDYVTPGRNTKIYDLMQKEALTAARSDAYTKWESRFVGDNKETYADIKNKTVDKYIDELIKVIYG